MNKFILAPSILSADFTHLSKSIEKIHDAKAEWVHIDVMDGIFVPNISFGQPVVSAIRPLTDLIFDVHLMINHPENHIEQFAKCGADAITFHWESTMHHHRIIQRIHDLGKKAGICIVPSTPVSMLESVLPYVDIVLVMSVDPGFGGQTLIAECLKKIERLLEMRKENGYSYKVSIDGGVNKDTIDDVIKTGVDVIVTGSAFFNGSLIL